MPGASDDAPDGAAPLSLSGPERSVLELLRAVPDDRLEESEVVRRLGLPDDQVRGSLQRLRSKHLAVVEESPLRTVHLTPRGKAAASDGLPERRLLEAIVRDGALGVDAPAWTSMDTAERSASIGILRRHALLEDGMPLRLRPGARHAEVGAPEARVLAAVAGGASEVDETALAALERRGLVRVDRRTTKRWAVSEEGRRLTLAPISEFLRRKCGSCSRAAKPST